MALADRVEVDPVRFMFGRAAGVDGNIRPGEKTLPCRGVTSLEHDAVFRRAQVQEEPGRLRVGDVAREGASGAQRVASGWLDFGDIGAHAHQQLATVGGGNAGPELNNADASQSGHGAAILRGARYRSRGVHAERA